MFSKKAIRIICLVTAIALTLPILIAAVLALTGGTV